LRSLGRGQSYRSLISSFVLATMIVFYLFSIGSFFELDIYYLEDRTTVHVSVSNMYMISRQVDGLVLSSAFGLWLMFSLEQRRLRLVSAITVVSLLVLGFVYSYDIIGYVSLLSIPVVALATLVQKFFYNRLLWTGTSSLTLNYLCVGIIILALSSIVISLLTLVADQEIEGRDYFIDSFYLLSRFSPVIMFLLIFAVPLRSLLAQAASRLTPRHQIVNFRLIPEKDMKRSVRILALSLCALFSILITLIPHLSPENRVIGVDTNYYVNWIKELEQTESVGDFISHIFTNIGFGSGDRPLSILFLYLLTRPYITEDLFAYIEHLVPAILAPLLTLSIYFLTREITKNDLAALLSAFITTVSFQVVIGIYAGFYANWISLIFGYFSLVYLFKGLQNPSKLNMTVFVSLLVIVLFTHVYTYTIFVVFLSIFLLTGLFLKKYPKRIIVIFLIIITSTVLLDFIRSLNNPSLAGIEGDLSAAETTGSGVSQFGYRWDNLVRTVQVFLGGGYSNILLLSLALYASLALYSKTNYAVFISIFLSLGILPLFFANRDLMSRVLYDIPFQLPAAFSLVWIRQNSTTSFSFIFPCALVSLTAIAVYMLSNF
jgi:hypothetical protein